MSRRRGAMIGLALLATACQEAMSPSDPLPPLFEVSGSVLIGEDFTEAADLRVAIRWRSWWGLPESVETQDVPVTLGFPARFEIRIDEVPRDEAMIWGDDWAYAMGELLIYADRNGNGRLDLVTPDDPEPLDHIYGPREPIHLTYFEGSPEAYLAEGTDMELWYVHRAGVPLRPGFTLREQDPAYCGSDWWREITDLTTIALVDSDFDQTRMCRYEQPYGPGNGPISVDEAEFMRTDRSYDVLIDEPTDFFPLQDLSSELSCWDDGRAYHLVELDNITWESACTGIWNHHVTYTVRLAEGLAPPANWPCEPRRSQCYSPNYDNDGCYWVMLDPCWPSGYEYKVCPGDEGYDPEAERNVCLEEPA